MKILRLIRSWVITVRNWWWRRQRRFDVQYLWPVCKQYASSLRMARKAFAVHAFKDPAWVKYYGEDGLMQEIDKLE